MPELVIKYKNQKTLDALLDFSKYFDFTVISSSKKMKKKNIQINGITLIPADDTINTSEMEIIFSNKNLDSKQLRVDAWQRNK
jgi:hypothetical protein